MIAIAAILLAVFACIFAWCLCVVAAEDEAGKPSLSELWTEPEAPQPRDIIELLGRGPELEARIKADVEARVHRRQFADQQVTRYLRRQDW